MPTFRIQVVNRHFTSSTEIDRPDIKAARSEALKGALEIATEEICQGSPFFGAEVSIHEETDVLERLVIAVGASPLY